MCSGPLAKRLSASLNNNYNVRARRLLPALPQRFWRTPGIAILKKSSGEGHCLLACWRGQENPRSVPKCQVLFTYWNADDVCRLIGIIQHIALKCDRLSHTLQASNLPRTQVGKN